MSRIKLPFRASRRRRGSQTGAFAVEFALVSIAFFTLLFGVIELARIIYMWNTLQEVTRSAARMAAYTDFTDSSAMNQVRQRAIFRDSPGTLVFAAPVSDAHIRIDYLALVRASNGTLTLTPIPDSALANCASRNRLICTANPSDTSCIRFVRARVCEPGSGACQPVGYVPLVPLVQFTSLSLPASTTIVRAETLGYQPGQPLCP